MKHKSIYNLFNRSYRDYIHDKETLRLLNVIILSAAVGMLLFANSGGTAFTGFASSLGAGEFAFGVIYALPVLAGLLQLLVSYLIEKTGKRKGMFMIGGIIQRSAWFVAAFIPYIFPAAQSRVWALVMLVTLAAMGGSFVSVTHMSLMANVIPIDLRGRYITTRQRISTLFSLVTGLGAAFLLDNMPGFSGYTVIFAVGGIAGIADILMYSGYKFPEIPRNEANVSLLNGMKACFTEPKTRDYMLFWIFWSFAVNISAPFFGKYAIDVLSLSFTQVIIFGQITANILSMLIVRRWGIFIDRYGSTPLLMLSTAISALGVSVWLFAVPGSVVPLFLFNFIGGFFWCANDACMVNMQFSHTPEKGRPVALAVYAVVTSIATAAALVAGGAILEVLAPVMDRLELTVLGTTFDHYKLIFCITLLLRVTVIAVFLPRVWNDKGMSLRQAYKKAFTDINARIRYEKARFRLPRFRFRRK